MKWTENHTAFCAILLYCVSPFIAPLAANLGPSPADGAASKIFDSDDWLLFCLMYCFTIITSARRYSIVIASGVFALITAIMYGAQPAGAPLSEIGKLYLWLSTALVGVVNLWDRWVYHAVKKAPFFGE